MLVLSTCPLLARKDFQRLGRLPKLRHLSIPGMHGVTQEDLEAICSPRAVDILIDVNSVVDAGKPGPEHALPDYAIITFQHMA